MATLLLTAVGTMVGGPIGGAIGALAGRSIDGAIIGGTRREGPRVKELAVTTSSYGQPIARHFGRMRTAGTIIWATDLVEHAASTGGGKGKPAVTSYAYSTSFAVALSSRPILGVGRIWADGNLLRGAGGDLKVAGAIRVHTGHGDQAPDPLIAAAVGQACSAFRDCAYVVFEDLALENFGNRIPALTFEIVADEGPVSLAGIIAPVAKTGYGTATLGSLDGFADEGGPLSATLATIDTLFPLAIDAGADRLTVALAGPDMAPAPLLPPAASGWDEEDTDVPPGAADGIRETRGDANGYRPDAVRYYDVARDYQPGVQRAGGRASGGRPVTTEFPGAMDAGTARALADDAARRARWQRTTMSWRMAELDPRIAPGTVVRVPGRPGLWRIESWEWRTRGIELALVRHHSIGPMATDGGSTPFVPPADLVAGATRVVAFEIPPASADPGEPIRFAAATSIDGAWNGAALYLDRAGELVPIGFASRRAATLGALAERLAGAPGLLFDPAAQVEVTLTGANSGSFASTSVAGLAGGANRLLIGEEVVQFARAEETVPGRWRLTGLLRGRGGTEGAAMKGHDPGTPVVLIDDALTALDMVTSQGGAATVVAAIGLGDAEPAFATLANPGLGSRPLSPVHPRAVRGADGGLSLGWTRRARGAWLWLDEVDVPLVEETESYLVGIGPVDAPIATWPVTVPELRLSAEEIDGLAMTAGTRVWVRQIGRHAQSDPLLLGRLS